MALELNKIIDSVNIAEDLKEEDLIKIGNEVVEGFEADKKSRKDWEDDCEKWIKLALQVADAKTYPWPKASNVKYPLISTAAMQFAARAYPSLIPSDGNVVKCKPVGFDPIGEKQGIAERISKYMSYQVLEEMEEWEDDMDRLMVILPIIGMCYKKTYYCPIKKRNVSCLVLPNDLVVNYWAKDIEDAERKTEILWFTKQKIKEKQLNDIYSDIELGEPNLEDQKLRHISVDNVNIPNENDSTTPYCILEQHAWRDLDGDGYAEPYVFTVEKSSRKVLRIAPRFTPDDIKTDEEGEVISIQPIEYYTRYVCIPNPDGSGYAIGFGRLLGSINDSVDTLINQLIDSGSLNNLQAGFLGKGLRIKMADTRFTPGEWKTVNATGDDLRKQIFPLPTKEPSPVLFQLLGMLVQSGKELASVAEIFVGKMPGQNTPAYTTKETVEQGMKLFTAIYKRVYRAMKKEFQKLYRLNKIYTDPNNYVDVLGIKIGQEDFTYSEKQIAPAADPMATSKTEKTNQAQNILQMLPIGTINPMEATKRALEAMEVPNIELLMNQQQQPSPESQKMQADMQMKQQESQMKMEVEKLKAQLKAQEQMMKMQFQKQAEEIKIYFEQLKLGLEAKKMMQEHMFDMQKGKDDMAMSQQQHALNMKQSMDKIEMQKQADKAKESTVKEPKPK